MKTFLILLLAAFFNNIRTQEPPKKVLAKTKQVGQEITDKEFVVMRDKKVWINKNGKDSLLTNLINIGGVQIMADGSITLKDGTASILKEGDKVTANGVVIRSTEEVPAKK